MSKIKSNPDFTPSDNVAGAGDGQRKVMIDDDVLELAGANPEEGGEGGEAPEGEEAPVEEPGEEGNQPESPAGEEPGEEGEPPADPNAKAKELKGVKDGFAREESKLDTELEALQKEIEERRASVVQKRTQRRELRKQKGQPLPASEEGAEEQGDDLSDLEPTDVKNIERVLKSRGYARKDEVVLENLKTAQGEVEQAFYKANPQYTPERDTNDTLYNALQDELALFAPPKTRGQMERILQRAHEAVKSRFPDKFKGSSKPQSNAAGDAANRARMNLAGAGAGNAGASAGGRKSGGKGTLSEADKATYRSGGWTEEEIAELDS